MGVIRELQAIEQGLPSFRESPLLFPLDEPLPPTHLAEHRAAVEAVIESKLGELGLRDLAVYEGDAETALLHSFGLECLGQYGQYADGEIAKLQSRLERAPVLAPVLLITPGERNARAKDLDYTSFFAAVDTSNLRFVSTIERQEGVKAEVFSNRTVGVTHKTISLKAPAVKTEGHLFLNDAFSVNSQGVSEIPLYASSTADNNAGWHSPGFGFNNSHINYLDGAALHVSWREVMQALYAGFNQPQRR